ncbi:hypothetical protein AYI68_g3768 [Smittium mucronatum]|uniref:Uncharacterized protein n=1 Tax=Smittium mucronatum TaxID=133383 RepID=A0A1R0GZ04_9FUNG|nr:hypothetical protein AYI68_g3768 [Smittium mucronatum]
MWVGEKGSNRRVDKEKKGSYNSLTTPIYIYPLLPLLTTLSVCTAPTVGIIGENLTGGLELALNERHIKEDTRSSITASPSKLTDGSKSSPSAKTFEEEDNKVSLSLSSTTSRQASISGKTHKAPTVGIIGENLTGGLELALNERHIKEDTRSSITASPSKLTDGSKSSPSAKTFEEEDNKVSLSLSSTTSRQASISGENP